jgi:hypothetical protein
MILFAYKTAMGLDKKLLQLMDGSFPNFLLVEENQRSAVIFKTGNIPSTWSWLNAVVRFECENSAIDVIINFL